MLSIYDDVIKFSGLLALCEGNSPVTGEFLLQRPVTRSFDVFFDLRLNKRLSKKSWGWWFETPSRSIWRHCNEIPTKLAHRWKMGQCMRVFYEIWPGLIFALVFSMLYTISCHTGWCYNISSTTLILSPSKNCHNLTGHTYLCIKLQGYIRGLLVIGTRLMLDHNPLGVIFAFLLLNTPVHSGITVTPHER